MSDTSNGVGGWIDLFIVAFWMWCFFFTFYMHMDMDVAFLASFIATIFTACVIAAIIRVIRERSETIFIGAGPAHFVYFVNRDRSESTSKSGDVLNDDTLDIHMPIRTPKQWDTVTPVYNIEEVGEYAECPYCGSNIRETFYELGGVVRCNKCGALRHRECFEYYGRKCGSPSCKLKET